MATTIYLIRHSGPFVILDDIDNTDSFEEVSANLILSVEAEEKAKQLYYLEEFEKVDKIYSSKSARAIATAKYIAAKNDMSITIANSLNERKFGIYSISELPEDYIKKQFEDENYKLMNGESINDVKKRLNIFIKKEVFLNKNKKSVFVLHAIAILSYLKNFCDVEFKDDQFKIKYNNKEIFNNKMGNPEVFKLEFDKDDRLMAIENVKIEKTNISYFSK